MTDDLDEPWICKMSRRGKMKHLQSVCFASEFETKPTSEAELVKYCTPRHVPSTVALLQNHFLEFCVEHGLEFEVRDLQESFIFTQQMTHDVEPRWASDSWPTLADHQESQRHTLVYFCLERISKSSWWRCVRLMVNSLTC